MARQRRIHFKSERDSRRRAILAAFARLDVEVILYDATTWPSRKPARDACLCAVVDDCAAMNAQMLVIERRLRCPGRPPHRPRTGDQHRLRGEVALPAPAGSRGAAACHPRRRSVELVTGRRLAAPRPRTHNHRPRCAAAVDARNPAHPPSGRLPGSLRWATAQRSYRLPTKSLWLNTPDPGSRPSRTFSGALGSGEACHSLMPHLPDTWVFGLGRRHGQLVRHRGSRRRRP